MQCLSPITIKVKGKGHLPVPCGRCAACLQNRRNSWSFRLEQELKVSTSAHFVTLTYTDDKLYFNEYGNPSVNKRDVQLFIKRLRKLSDEKLRYYAVAEYGSKTHRPHYHIILFNLSHDFDSANLLLTNAWGNGQIQVGSVTPASIAYVTKYVFQKGKNWEGEDKVFSLMSRKPGIGSNYLDTHTKWHEEDPTRFYSVKEGGQKVSLPRFYRDKIYSQQDKETHAMKCADLTIQSMRKEHAKHASKYPEKDFNTLRQERKENYARQILKNHQKNDKL